MNILAGKKLLLISTSSGSRGGGEIAFMQQAEGLIALGYNLQLLVSDDPRMDELVAQYSDSVPIQRIPYRNTYDKRLRFLSEIVGKQTHHHLRRILADYAPDLVHLNKQNLEDGLDWIQVLQASGLPSAVTIYVPNSMASLGARFGSFRDKLLRRQFRNLQSVLITVSEASRSNFQDFLGAGHRTRIEVIPTGVPDVQPGDRDTFRQKWNIPDEIFVIGTIARIEHQKNPLFAVRLLAELPERVHLVWVGDGRLRAEMEQHAEQAGVSHRLHLLGWKQNATAHLAGFDLFVLPSRYEGFPLAILEAMAAGVPCVVSDVDGNVESVIHQETGLVFPLDDLDACKNAIIDLAGCAKTRKRFSAAGRRRYEERFSLQAMSRQTADLYNQMLNTGTRS